MPFEGDYWNALDKRTADELDVSPADIGIAHGAGDVLEGLQANIRAGAKVVELGFTGTGKGSLGQGSTNPEMFGKDKREAIRQLGKINDVTVTTHASIGAQGLAGLDREGRGFSDLIAENNLTEIRRAVDFASEATDGGPVVIHTTEFPREISKYDEFESYHVPEGEIPKEEIVTLIDKDTGRIFPIQKGQKIYVPKWEKNEKGEYVDARGNTISENEAPTRGVPLMKPDGRVDFDIKTWNDFVEDAEKIRKETGKDEDPGRLFFMAYRRAQLERAKPFAKSYYDSYKNHQEALVKLQEKKEACEKLLKKSPEKKEFYAVMIEEELREMARRYGIHGVEFEMKYGEDPVKFLREKIDELDSKARSEKEGFIGYEKEIEEVERLNETVAPIEGEGIKRSTENLARVAIYTYDKEKSQKLEKPLYIAPENIFPEGGYGSHPQELKRLILESRDIMAKKLQDERGMSASKAKNIAQNHIKATFDIGHAYTWKKFFKRKESETFEDHSKRFNKWLMDQVEDLTEADIIGHIHLSDNFGYYDEHLTPGMGSVPFKDFVEKVKKKGFKGLMIAEPGAQAEGEMYQVMTGAWGLVATAPLYRTRRTGWTDIEDSYFGKTQTPRYLFGKFAPSEEFRGVSKEGPFWSGVGLE